MDIDELARMRSRFTIAVSATSASREDELDDLRFMAGSPDNRWQWPSDVVSTRSTVNGQGARPCLTINKLPQHVRQVTNDQRQNRPSGKVIPSDDRADVEVAEIYDGIVRHIEYISDADVAYDTACDNQVTFGEGYIRLVTEYCRDDSFDQDIRIRRIRNSFSVYMDPAIQDPCGSDAQWCFITEDMTKEEYERQFPKASPISSLMQQGVGDRGQWINENTVRIAEYFYIEYEPQTLNLYPGNVTAVENDPQDTEMKMMGLTPIRQRKVDIKKVKWCKTNGFEFLEKRDWAGKWIPVIRVIGNEFEVDGRLYVSGLTRNAKDAQRMYNYWPLALDTPIPTPTGWLTMGSIRAGDVVFDEKGAPCEVVAKSPVYINKDCFKVTFDDGSEIVADGDHRWCVETRGKRTSKTYEWTTETVATSSLTPGKHFIYTSKPIESSSSVPIDPYLLGVWLGDGDTINPQITQCAEDVEEMRRLLIDRGFRVGLTRNSGTAKRFTVHGIRGTLVSMGVLGDKHIPTEYLRATVDQRMELLRGLMDTDGSVSKNGQCSFTTTLEKLKDGFMELVRSLGIKVSVCERAGELQFFANSGKTYQCSNSWQISFSLRPDMRFFNLDRKLMKGKTTYHPRRTCRFGIKRVERVSSVPVQCITVDSESHLFLAGLSMVPTHNCSQEAEMLALAPKAPFIGYGGQFEGYEQQWKTANTTNWPYLEVNPDATDGQGAVLPLPQRAQPPMASSGLLQAKLGASDDIKATTGQYDSSIGATSNERSGKAILARERQGDTGTYHYIDNLARAVRYTTRQIVDLIPKIYDTARIARIIGVDGETSMAKINPNQQEAVKRVVDHAGVVIEKIYNPGVGVYDVCVTTGPGYATKRQESLEAMSVLLQGNPQLWAVAGDLFIKNMDWPGAQEMAERFKKTIDPKLLSSDDENPELQAAQQQIQMMGQEMEQMHQMIKNVGRSIEMQDQERKDFEATIKAYDAETKRIAQVQANMSPDQIQDIVMGTIHSMITSGDLMQQMPPEGQMETQPT